MWFETVTGLLICSLFTHHWNVVTAVTTTASIDISIIASSHSINGHTNIVKPLPKPGKLAANLPPKIKIPEPTADWKSVGYAAEWEYKGSGLEELDGPLETQHEEQLSPSSLLRPTKINAELKTDPISNNPSLSPSRRLGPGTWLDSNGYWWLFGGQGPTASPTTATNRISPINYLSDLWVYRPPSDPDTLGGRQPSATDADSNSYWKLVYRPENNGESPLSSYPENVQFPFLCGSENSGHLSLFPGQNWDTKASQEKTEESRNSLFNEDGVVWLSDIPKSFKEMSGRRIKSGGNGCNWPKTNEQGRKRSCNGTEGLLWTSYICCDACLPDGNTTFDFCPQFSKEPILWCNHDSLMAFQLTMSHSRTSPTKPEIPDAKGKQATTSSLSTTLISPSKIPEVSQQRNITEDDFHSAAKMGESISTVSHIFPNITTRDFMKNGSNSQGVGQPEKAKGKNAEENEKNTPHRDNSTREESDEEQSNALEGKVQSGSGSGINGAEVLPTSTTTRRRRDLDEKLVVNWWKFDLTSTEWMKMPEVNISLEDAEQVQSGNCRSVSDQDFLYILCPTKTNLLDRSVLLFNPKQRSVYSLGTIHLNNAFHDKKVWHLGCVFHALRSDNQTVIFLAYHKLLDLWIHDHSSNKLLAVENVWKGSSLHAFQHSASFYKLTILIPTSTISQSGGDPTQTTSGENKAHSFYMVNPRSKLLTFEDPYPGGHFQITIVTDRSVFLPSRDAPVLINASDFLNKSNNGLEKPSIQKEISSSQGQKSPGGDPSKVQPMGLKRDQSIYSHISITKPSRSESKSESKQKDNNQGIDSEGRRTVAGLRKSQGLSPYSKTSNHTVQVRDQISNIGKGELEVSKLETETPRIPDAVPDSQEKAKTSQYPNPDSSTSKNYNKANNSQLKGKVEVIPGSKNKRILGIKRTLPETTKIDDSLHHPIAMSSITMRSIANIHPLNEMRSQASRGSLPVNNESNRKPLSTLSGSGESANSSSKDMADMHEAGKVVQNVSGMTSEKGDHPPTPAERSEARVNLSITPSPEASELKVAPGIKEQSQHHPESPSLPVNLETKTDQWNFWTSPSSRKSNSPTEISTKDPISDENHNSGNTDGDGVDDGDQPNLENNYVSSRRTKDLVYLKKSLKKEESVLMTHSANDSFMGDMGGRELSPLTYGSSEIVIDSPTDNVQSINQDVEASYYTSYSTFGSILFFSLSLSIFASFGLFVFVRRCVRCPPRSESVLIKEPPPIRYSVIPNELSFHTPLV